MKRFLTTMLLVAGTLQIAQADDSMGHTVFDRGAVTAQKFDGAIRLLGTDAPLYEGDTLSTAKKALSSSIWKTAPGWFCDPTPCLNSKNSSPKKTVL